MDQIDKDVLSFWSGLAKKVERVDKSERQRSSLWKTDDPLSTETSREKFQKNELILDIINIIQYYLDKKRLHYQILKYKKVSWTKISKIWRWKETDVQIIKGVLLQMTHISQNSCHPNTKESTYCSVLKENDRLLLCNCSQVLSDFFSIKYAFALFFPSFGVSVEIKFGQYYKVGSSWSGSTAQQKWYTFSILPLSIGSMNVIFSIHYLLS